MSKGRRQKKKTVKLVTSSKKVGGGLSQFYYFYFTKNYDKNTLWLAGINEEINSQSGIDYISKLNRLIIACKYQVGRMYVGR